MKEKIIKQMEAVVADVMTDYQSDFFNYDKPRIESPEFKFPCIWIVGAMHTHRLELGNYQDFFYEAESMRYDYLRDSNPYAYFTDTTNYAKDYWFLVTENGLQSINREQAKSAIKDYVTPAVKAWERDNGPLPKLTKVPVYIHDTTFGKLKKLFAECQAHGDNSLMECLRRFHSHRRVSSDQCVKVYYNERYNEFSFGEYINGQCRMNGGIIFHGWPETGYEENGSVQLDPRYGWSSHT